MAKTSNPLGTMGTGVEDTQETMAAGLQQQEKPTDEGTGDGTVKYPYLDASIRRSSIFDKASHIRKSLGTDTNKRNIMVDVNDKIYMSAQEQDDGSYVIVIGENAADGTSKVLHTAKSADEFYKLVYDNSETWWDFIINIANTLHDWETYSDALHAQIADAETINERLNDTIEELQHNANASNVSNAEYQKRAADVLRLKREKEELSAAAAVKEQELVTLKQQHAAVTARHMQDLEDLRTEIAGHRTTAEDSDARCKGFQQKMVEAQTLLFNAQREIERLKGQPPPLLTRERNVRFDMRGQGMNSSSPQMLSSPPPNGNGSAADPFNVTDYSAANFPRAHSHLSNSSSSAAFKIPDIETFKGNGDDYEKWRMTAVDKLETIEYPADQIRYLRRYLSGHAFDVVRHIQSQDPRVWLAALDEAFNGVDRIAEAETKLFDGSLMMKTTETFNEWYTRFVGVVNRLDMNDRTRMTHAYRLLTYKLSSTLTAGATPGETFAQFILRARTMEQRLNDAKIGRSYAGNNRDTTYRSTRLGSSSRQQQPAARSQPKAGPNARIAYGRTSAERDAMVKKGMCFKCGEKGHRPLDSNAPCKLQPITPSKDIRGLSAMDARLAAMTPQCDEEVYGIDENGNIMDEMYGHTEEEDDLESFYNSEN